jgi:hypothetical protein
MLKISKITKKFFLLSPPGFHRFTQQLSFACRQTPTLHSYTTSWHLFSIFSALSCGDKIKTSRYLLL